ncbi:unnamed protein product, partial [Rotaria sp. Silwood2]
LRINSQYRGSPIYIPEYDQFAVDNDRQNYKLQILYFLSNISTVCDSLSSSWDNTNGILFSTYDHDYDSYALNYHDIPEYDQFAVDNESQNNKLKTLQFLSNISTVGDSLLPSWDNTNGISFSTYDHDYDSYTLNYHST